MHCERDHVMISGATHLFEEPGRLEQVVALAADSYAGHLGLVVAG